MKYVYNDGGRRKAGYDGTAGDCVVRAVAIATKQSYQSVYEALSIGAKNQRKTKHSRKSSSARNGVFTKRKWFRDYMARLGWKWIPTMGIGTGCKVHLNDGELPFGRLIVAVSRHYTAVIDGVIFDTFDPQREIHCVEQDTGRELKTGEWRNVNGICRVMRRCVYGYWMLANQPEEPPGNPLEADMR